MSTHRIEVTIGKWGADARIVCPGGDIACRLVSCEKGCEDYDSAPKKDAQGWFHLAYDYAVDGDVRHPMVTESGFCNHREFIDNCNDSVLESFDGPDSTPLRDGPIDFTWTGDTYMWHYTTEGTNR